MKIPFLRNTVTAFAFILGSVSANAQSGRIFPTEKSTFVDPITGAEITVLTSDPAGSAKPYQTHPTWTADGNWIIFRSNRTGSSQAFIVNEQSGEIMQITDGPATGTGSLNLSRREMKLFYMRGGPVRGSSDENRSIYPRQLIELNLGSLIVDARSGRPRTAAEYERVIVTLPADLRDSGGFTLDADETKAYWGVSFGPSPARSAAAAGERRQVDDANTNPAEAREAARRRFAEAGRGPGGIRAIDLRSGKVTAVIDVDLRMGHVQANPWVPGEILYCHETTGDSPQRIWAVNSDGIGNRPVYAETAEEWITHETFSNRDEVMFNVMGHLPYLRERPTGVAVVNLRNGSVTLLGQIDEDLGGDRRGGFWHCNGSLDGRWAVADSFRGDIHLIRRSDGRCVLLTTGHVMKPDHTHPIFSPDSRRVLIQSGRRSEGKFLELMTVKVPLE